MNQNLYKELLKIGSDARSIEPNALRPYAHLLNCYEVRRRAKGSTDISVLAEHASQALKEQIDSFARQDPRALVVRIRFGIEPDYENLKIKQRKARFAEREGYSEKTFRYHTEEAVKRMAELLEPDAVDPFVGDRQRPAPQPVATDHNPEHQAILSLVATAANLHYALLASLFTRHFNERFEIAQSLSYYLPVRSEASEACFERVFESMMHFGVRSEEVRNDDTAPDSELSADWIKPLLTLIGKTRNAMPPADKTVRAAYLLGIHLPDDGGNSEIDRLHEDCRKWYSGNEWGKVSPQNIEPVAAGAGAIVALVARNIEFGSPVVADARTAAHKTLAYYYDFDEDARLFDGQSLRRHVDAYFDSRSATLANSKLA
jgi:hypothetical protein